MRKIYCLFVLICLNFMSYAQEGFHKIGVGAEIALPMGDFSNGYSVGFGATGKAFYSISEDGDITGTLGYLYFGMKSTDYMSGHASIIPLQFGYHHNFDGLYVEPQLGLMFVTAKIKETGMFGFEASNSETKFSLGIGGGYEYGDWDFGLRYQILEHANFIGLRIGYNFLL